MLKFPSTIPGEIVHMVCVNLKPLEEVSIQCTGSIIAAVGHE